MSPGPELRTGSTGCGRRRQPYPARDSSSAAVAGCLPGELASFQSVRVSATSCRFSSRKAIFSRSIEWENGRNHEIVVSPRMGPAGHDGGAVVASGMARGDHPVVGETPTATERSYRGIDEGDEANSRRTDSEDAIN